MDKREPQDLKEQVDRGVSLLRAVDAGTFEGLECPNCGYNTVSAWFTHPAEAQYLTWLVCARCPFEARAINTYKNEAKPISMHGGL